MAYKQGITLCIPTKMIVGRWYKLTGMTYGRGVPWDCKQYFTCNDATKCFLLHDTVYVKSTGNVTFTVTDQDGYSDSMTVEFIDEPSVTRTSYEITPASWDDLQTKITECGEYSDIKITKGTYHFVITDTMFDIPEGVRLDFQDSKIYWSASDGVTRSRMFNIVSDYTEIKNVTFESENADDWEHTEQSDMIHISNGYNCKVIGVHFIKEVGFGFTIGDWNPTWSQLPSYSTTRWNTSALGSGRIDSNGEFIECDGAYSTSEFCDCATSSDNGYTVGIRNCWIPTNSRLYNIAFYDENYNFIELRENQQYYRKYFYPSNAKYWKASVYQDTAPAEQSGGDDVCFFRIFGSGTNSFGQIYCVRELVIENITALENESGLMSFVGCVNEVHLNKIRCDTNGTVNGWGFDIEDNWNSLINVVMSHSIFKNSSVVIHSPQGMSVISAYMDNVVIKDNPYSIAFYNSAIKTACVYSNRNYILFANSSVNKESITAESSDTINPYHSGDNVCGTASEILSAVNAFVDNYKVQEWAV